MKIKLLKIRFSETSAQLPLEFRIKRESPPSRCDVCHKEDHFDGIVCTHCTTLLQEKLGISEVTRLENWQGTTYGVALGLFLGLIAFVLKEHSGSTNGIYATAVGLVIFGAILGTLVEEGVRRFELQSKLETENENISK
ncbi:MAG: hypothetical protein JNN15_11165 [Blastocatellia bacterium]|nr:hypothetical protein [Blastocatellia bacterium]